MMRPLSAFLLGGATALLLAAMSRPTDTAAAITPPADARADAARTATPQDPQDPQAAMREMMAKAKKFTQPGEHHQKLERFVGTWTTATRITMGPKTGKAEAGTVTIRWLMPGRWLVAEGKSTFMGQPQDLYWLLGYDNFKQSYVMTTLSNLDTAMLHFEGDMTPDDKALITYGTLDEYLTGEHDKMVRYVYRFLSDDKFVLEVHDLPIGETDTKVVEITYTRA